MFDAVSSRRPWDCSLSSNRPLLLPTSPCIVILTLSVANGEEPPHWLLSLPLLLPFGLAWGFSPGPLPVCPSRELPDTPHPTVRSATLNAEPRRTTPNPAEPTRTKPHHTQQHTTP